MTLIEKRQLHNNLLRLYDPPVDGCTPLDGAGNPMQSYIRAADVPAKLARGFTHEPRGVAPPPDIPEPQSAALPVDRGKRQTRHESLRYSG